MTLSVLAIGCGRDGTSSITRILEDAFRRNGREDVRAIHECDNAEIYAAARVFIANGDPEPARAVISRWGQDVESGNGYAFILPVFREVFGPDLKIIHLRRNRADNVKSMVNHTSWNPSHWGGYVAFDGPFEIVRPTAVDLEEISAPEWKKLTLQQRIEWYYETTHTTVENHKPLFRHVFEMSTDDLNNPGRLEELTSFLDPNWRNPASPSHLNANLNYDFASMTPEQRRKARKMWRHFDFQKAIGDPEYGLRHFARLAMARGPEAEPFFSLPPERLRGIFKETERDMANERKPRNRPGLLEKVCYKLRGQ